MLRLLASFLGQDRADRVDQMTARPQQFCRQIEQSGLKCNDLLQPLCRQPPARFRIAAPGSAPRAGGVDEHKVELAAPLPECLGLSPRIEKMGGDVAGPGPLGAGWQLREASAI